MAELTAGVDRRRLGRDVKIIGLVSTAHLTSHFYQLVLPPIFPLLKDAFGVGYAELGIVMTLLYATSGLMQTPAGILVDRLGPTRVLLGGLGLYAVAVLLFGFAPNIWVLALLAIAAGIGNCVFHPSDYAILTARVEAARLGRAYAAHNFAGSLGWAAAPVAVLALTAAFGWRVAVSALGGLGLLLTFYLLSQSALLTTEVRRRLAGEARVRSAGIFLSPPILTCFGYFTLLSVAWAGLQPLLPSTLVSSYGVSVEVANGALTSFLLGSALGIFTGGIIADRFGRPELVVAAGLLTAAMLSLSIGLLSMPVAALFICVAVAGLASGATTPSRDLLVRGATPSGATGKVFGFVYSGLDLGSAAAPPFLGLLLDHQLPRLVFVVVAGALLLAIATAFVVGRGNAGRRPAVPQRTAAHEGVAEPGIAE